MAGQRGATPAEATTQTEQPSAPDGISTCSYCATTRNTKRLKIRVPRASSSRVPVDAQRHPNGIGSVGAIWLSAEVVEYVHRTVWKQFEKVAAAVGAPCGRCPVQMAVDTLNQL